MPTLGIIGVGGLGTALVSGVIRSKTLSPSEIFAFDAIDANTQRAASLGAVAAKSAAEAASAALVVLAIKPKDLLSLLDSLRNHLKPGQILVSVAAGVRLRVLAEHVPPGVRVVRAMPNVGAALGVSMTALVAGAGADTGLEEARAAFSAIGEVALLSDESQLDAATALAASGPAFLFLALEALADGGVQAGLPRDIARRMASQAMKATALLAQESGKHTAELKDSIASPAGTTMAGLSVLESRGTRGAFLDAVDAATRRARELGEK